MSNRQRALVGGLAVLGCVGVSVGLIVSQAPEHQANSVVVDDTAGVLHLPTLEDGVEDLRFYQPTDVAVFTINGGEASLTDDLALNTAVLQHARTERPEWLSADEQKWADNLFIFAVDPEGRLVGTYFGENRSVDPEMQLSIQDAAKDDFRQADWTDGTIAGLEAGASRIEAPLMRTGGGYVLAGLTSLFTMLGAGAWVGVGMHRARRCRELRAEGDRRMASVIAALDTTELHARLIPTESRYGGRVLHRYDEYRRGVRELTELGNQARAIPKRDHNRKDARTVLTAYRDTALELDELDDVIADTATFLNRETGWVEAWGRQERPLRKDLEQVESLLSTEVPASARALPQAQALREFASAGMARLDQLRGRLEHGQVSPDDALDELRGLRDGLSGALDALGAAVADEVGDTDTEREMVRTALRAQRARRLGDVTIISASDPGWSWYPVDSFRTGISDGTTKVEQSRSSSSSGGSSGYSGGGSFSGAGSSSRF